MERRFFAMSFVLQAVPAVVLLVAFLAGKGSIRLTGLHIPLLAHDEIAMGVILAFASSVLVGIVFLARFALDHARADKRGFLVCWFTALLAVSAFVHSTGRVTFNGASLNWFTWPGGALLITLLCVFLSVNTSGRRSQQAQSGGPP